MDPVRIKAPGQPPLMPSCVSLNAMTLERSGDLKISIGSGDRHAIDLADKGLMQNCFLVDLGKHQSLLGHIF